MSYYADLGKSGKTIAAREGAAAAGGKSGKTLAARAAAEAAAAEAEGHAALMHKLLLFGGLGAAAFIGFKLLKKKKGSASAAPSISLFSAPKVP